jgi:hypothetical protein
MGGSSLPVLSPQHRHLSGGSLERATAFAQHFTTNHTVFAQGVHTGLVPLTSADEVRYQALLSQLRQLWKDLRKADTNPQRWGPRGPAYEAVQAKILDVGREMQRILETGASSPRGAVPKKGQQP